MADNDMLKRYLDAGVQFTQMTRTRAEAIVKELVRAGELQRDQAQGRAQELVEGSRRNTEQLLALVRKEVADQLAALGLATKADLEALESRVSGKARAAAKTAVANAPAARKPPVAKRASAGTAAKRTTGTA
ncbi:MAG TPA: hypothetical protein VM030_09470 [Acidimicrobiales bacterium]|nr:hypothetical protein [Acidimicrobiales bacterium]